MLNYKKFLSIFLISLFCFSQAALAKKPETSTNTITTSDSRELKRHKYYTVYKHPTTGREVQIEQFERENFVSDRKNGIMYIGMIDQNLIKLIDDEAKVYKILGHKKIIVDLHSPGGSMLAMDIINLEFNILKKEGFTIITRVTANKACMSACTSIFLSGDERIADPDTVFMFHSPWIDLDNVTKAEKIYYEQKLNITRNNFASTYKSFCGSKSTLHLNILDKKNHYFFPDAVEDQCSTYFTKIKKVEATPLSDNVVYGRDLEKEKLDESNDSCKTTNL